MAAVAEAAVVTDLVSSSSNLDERYGDVRLALRVLRFLFVAEKSLSGASSIVPLLTDSWLEACARGFFSGVSMKAKPGFFLTLMEGTAGGSAGPQPSIVVFDSTISCVGLGATELTTFALEEEGTRIRWILLEDRRLARRVLRRIGVDSVGAFRLRARVGDKSQSADMALVAIGASEEDDFASEMVSPLLLISPMAGWMGSVNVVSEVLGGTIAIAGSATTASEEPTTLNRGSDGRVSTTELSIDSSGSGLFTELSFSLLLGVVDMVGDFDVRLLAGSKHVDLRAVSTPAFSSSVPL